MSPLMIVARREWNAYFSTPLAYVFLVVFLVLCGFATFELGGFYLRNQADLQSFFAYQPWLYLFLVPAIAMRIWAEERKSGSIELLLTLPLKLHSIVLAKFLAAWLFIALALALTFPLWITVNYLGEPDNGAILAAYLGSWLMAGAFLSIGCCLSAASKSQVIVFVLTVSVCFLFVLLGVPQLLNSLSGVLPQVIVDGIAQLSLLTHFDAISRGVLDLRDVLFYLFFIACWLAATGIVIEQKKAE
ncbi:MAG TPA: ABC transporter permease subunit [Pseudomonadales bacterium]|nr:ABC transporter permease subunit [Pseudomonadales bacterium]